MTEDPQEADRTIRILHNHIHLHCKAFGLPLPADVPARDEPEGEA